GRTRDQGFSGSVNLPGIRAVVEAVKRIPIVGNGDIRTVADARTMFAETGCAAVGIGRGALLNPWIFQQCDAAFVAQASSLRTDDDRKLEACATIPQPTYEQRVDFMARHFEKLLAFRIERVACVQFRKVARWYGRALGVPKAMRHRLVMFKDAAEFRRLIAELRTMKPQLPAQDGPDPHFPGSSGPDERR
ncbi:MAG: tRNA dihydrouridine synthase DusB, partial [Verrucomicrobia bacterium]|nr:tRNA dihydrouridine synthase DusB [Verrucomicrobiota bacterium]